MNHPHLSELFKIYQSESQPFRKVHRMIDLFESLIKMHTVVIISEYVKHNKLSDTAKGMLAQGLRTPSLGTWQLFSRILFEELQQDGYTWTFTDFPAAFLALDKALNATKTNVVAFRNGYAHGATPTDEQCEADIKQFEPFLLQLLNSQWLTKTNLVQQDYKVWIRFDNNELCLHPILLFKEEAGASPYAFFNDLKNDKVGLLNYPLSKHYREKHFYEEFHQYLPLQEWKKCGNNEFYQRIEELTETFKGRTAEREKLLKFVLECNKGYFSIQGNPGIGKSALIAQFFKDLKPHKEIQDLQVVEYFIRRGTAQAQVEYVFNYLIRRTDELFPAGREIRAEGKAVWELQQQLFSKWRLWGEQNKGSKLLFLIDGLDEGVENNVVSYLPRENFNGVLVIYGSRPGGHKSIDELWSQLPVENHTKLELSGLGKEDIRALIYEVANKYEIDRESAWIDAVQQRSQGNPLYLKLLCDAMENGSIALNDIHALPEKIDEYYKAILDRYATDAIDGDALLNSLYTFTAAKDYLTMPHIGLINNLGEASLQRIGSTLKEVLYENPLTEDVLDYQLFHESFREYLVKEKTKQVNEAAERIIDFCIGWKELEGTWEQRYALEHFAAHLSESKKEARVEILTKLIYDNSFTATQKKVLKGFDASNAMYRLALKNSCESKRDDDMLEAALCLVDLKYEEANDAPQVVAMVANGDIDFALKRIESFGSADNEGIERKFILYMLCLMELTLLYSKDKPFTKSSIEKLLNHLDENIPVDHSLLSWNHFFSSYLMFLMACEWAEMGLDYLRVFRRTDELNAEWISEKGPYSEVQFEIMIECARSISSDSGKSNALNAISAALEKLGKVVESATVLQEALEFARGTKSFIQKSLALLAISRELANHGLAEESETLMIEAIDCANGIRDDFWKNSALEDIANELAKQGKIEEALLCARGMSEERKPMALGAISTKLVKLGKLEEGASVLKEALTGIGQTSYKASKDHALMKISIEIGIQGKFEYALELADRITSKYKKKKALNEIYTELAKQGKVEEALTYGQNISDDSDKCNFLGDISWVLAKQGKFEQSLKLAQGISNGILKGRCLNTIFTELTKQGKVEEGSFVLQESLNCTPGIGISSFFSEDILREISTLLAKQGKLEQSLVIVRMIDLDYTKNHTLITISTEAAKQGRVTEARECCNIIIKEWGKSTALRNISTELAKLGKMEEALECAHSINEKGLQSSALTIISTELAKQGKLDEGTSVLQQSLECAMGISDENEKSIALRAISNEQAKQGKVEEALSVLKEALVCAREISDSIYDRDLAIFAIATDLSKQGYEEESFVVMEELMERVRSLSSGWEKSCSLTTISQELFKQGKVEEALSVLQEALTCAHNISDKTKLDALRSISIELAEQGEVDEAIRCARSITAASKKSNALASISERLAKKENWNLAEQTGFEIFFIAIRHKCWEDIAKTLNKQYGIEEALRKVHEFKSQETKLFYLKGWSKVIKVNHICENLFQPALFTLVNDSDSLEKFLQVFAQHKLFFDNPSKEKINRLNKTLNIQWALDIIAKFPKEEGIVRSSTNLSDWIDEIQDEDDRDQVSLWAKQVIKGKISESEFEERINDLLVD